jgi:hypothetical protein
VSSAKFGKPDPMYVSYYTPDYVKYADRLNKSLDKAGVWAVDRHVVAVQPAGDWIQNCAMKPGILLNAIEEYERSVIWIDADAVLHKHTPEFWEGLIARRIDVAAHLPNQRRHPLCNSRLCSGTLFFNNTECAKEILADWSCECTEQPRSLDQEVLFNVIFQHHHRVGRSFDTSFECLPAEYCRIFDLMPDVTKPCIEHFQASREMRV